MGDCQPHARGSPGHAPHSRLRMGLPPGLTEGTKMTERPHRAPAASVATGYAAREHWTCGRRGREAKASFYLT